MKTLRIIYVIVLLILLASGVSAQNEFSIQTDTLQWETISLKNGTETISFVSRFIMYGDTSIRWVQSSNPGSEKVYTFEVQNLSGDLNSGNLNYQVHVAERGISGTIKVTKSGSDYKIAFEFIKDSINVMPHEFLVNKVVKL